MKDRISEGIPCMSLKVVIIAGFSRASNASGKDTMPGSIYFPNVDYPYLLKGFLNLLYYS